MYNFIAIGILFVIIIFVFCACKVASIFDEANESERSEQRSATKRSSEQGRIEK